MKKLLLVRHAKSSWDVSVPKDFDRPLNERGQTDAPDMAERLFKKDIRIDAFVSSPAKRALETATYFTKEYGYKEKNIIQIPALYEASVQVFYDVIDELNNDWNTVAIFSHNPTITEFANGLTTIRIDDMPTCSVFGVKCDIKKWKHFKEVETSFWFFDFPKLHK